MLGHPIWNKKISPLADGSRLVTVSVPSTLRKEMIGQCHDVRTAAYITTGWIWKYSRNISTVEEWIGTSRWTCATQKTVGWQGAKMCRYDFGSPMEEVAIDLMGPFPESETGKVRPGLGGQLLQVYGGISSPLHWGKDHSGEVCHGIYFWLWSLHPDQVRSRKAIWL